MKLLISKAILAAAVFSLLAVSITDARQRGGPQQPGALPKLTKVRDDIYLIENAGQTVAEIGTYGGNITLALTDEGVVAVDSKNESSRGCSREDQVAHASDCEVSGPDSQSRGSCLGRRDVRFRGRAGSTVM